MRRLLRVAAVFAALVATPSAVQTQPDHAGPSPSLGARMVNLAGESFDLNQPGDHLLWRLPRNRSEPALLDVRGNFTYSDKVTCALQLMTITLKGEWFDGKVVKVSVMSGFAVKVSAQSPAFAGPWRPFANFTVRREGQEALPENINVSTKVEHSTIQFRVGAKGAKKQPIVSITQNEEHKALDLNLLDVQWFDTKDFAGLLGNEKHSQALEVPSAECAGSRGKLRLRAQQRSSQLNVSWASA